MTSNQEFPQLSKVPITLAILEIRFKAPERVTNQSLKGVKQLLKEDYPTHHVTTDTQIELRPNQDKTAIQLKSNLSGHLLQSPSRKHEILLSAKSYNFKQHGQYTTWSDFQSFALDGWNKCKELVSPESITWLSLRYVNNIEMPIDGNSVLPAENLFKTYISNTGQKSNQAIGAYSIKYTHAINDKNLLIHFGQELLPGPIGTLPFIIDIDVIYNKVNKPTELNFEEKFSELRQIKNEYFFDNLTESTLKMLL